MLQIIKIDGKKYHADDEGVVILDENEEPIPAKICLCFAHCASSCVCGAWDIPLFDDDGDW
jgi:hypothetical protein